MNPCSDEIAKPANKGKLPKTKQAARKREGPARNCIALMNNIISENWEETRSCTYQRKTEREGRERDGTQHWLSNYAFYHFSHNRVPPFFSCPVYSCSCSSAALMRKIKNNHNHVIFTSTDHQIASYCSTHKHTHTTSQSCESFIVTVLSFFKAMT